ncbi:MAG TPA: LLM class F420-dependent oxidoreductase [Candidatus Limnocylindrales bacterium]|jgi:F420-dependent oxidoreductase-like protein
MSVWFGLHCPSYTFPDNRPERLFDQLLEQVRAAEDAGFGLVTVMDHLNQIPGIGVQDEPMLEAWSTLAALARETTRVRLGPLVTGVTYRNPALLAKTATTLDVISGGRAMLGLGAAWFEEEHESFGFSFPPIKERMDRLDEALSIARGMFREERSSFSGRLYETRDVINVPRPVRAGGPPILVGGGGEQRTLRIAAKHADMTHWFPLGIEALAHKTDVLRGYCEEIGRDPAEVERTMAAPILVAATEAEGRALWDRLPPERRAMVTPGTPAQVADQLRPYIDAGFTGFTFNNNVYRRPEQISILGELLRLVA